MGYIIASNSKTIISINLALVANASINSFEVTFILVLVQ